MTVTNTDDTRTIQLGELQLCYRDCGAGPPLLLLHGFTGSGADWKHVFDLEALARSYRLIMPDLRGHGGSNDPANAFTHRVCAEDMFALLDRVDVGRVKAVGTSLGGNVLLHMATRQPARIEAMVTVSSPSYFPGQARVIMRAHPQGHIFADRYDDMNFTPPLLGTITARTLIVAGDRDPLYPLEIFVEQYRAIPGSALYVVPGGGHGPIYGEARTEFVRAALAFLEGAGAGAGEVVS